MTDILPIGTVISYVGSDVNNLPENWLLCDGRLLSPSDYPALSRALANAFGKDASGNFYLPDLRGMFLRGVDGEAGNDPDSSLRAAQKNGCTTGNGNAGNAVGSVQADDLLSHSHALGLNNPGFYSKGDYSVYNPGSTQSTTGNTGGKETRPKNVYVYYLIYAGSDE